MNVQTSSQNRYVSRCPCRFSKHVLCAEHHPKAAAHLECEPRLHARREIVSNCLVEVGEDLHSQLGLDAPLVDKFVNRIDESLADARWRVSTLFLVTAKSMRQDQSPTCCLDTAHSTGSAEPWPPSCLTLQVRGAVTRFLNVLRDQCGHEMHALATPLMKITSRSDKEDARVRVQATVGG